MLDYIIFSVVSIFIAAAIASSIVITPQNNFSFVTLFGKYQKTMPAGLGFKIPFVTSVDKRLYLGLQEQRVDLNLKTKDQVTFRISLNIQFVISDKPSEAYKAVYNIEDYAGTMNSVATDASITVTNNIELEDVYNSKEKISNAAEDRLISFFGDDYGITIKKVLSDEPKLPEEVERQANAVIAAKREMESAKYQREAIYTRKVGEAEADGESAKIRMDRIGEARKAFSESAAASVKTLKKAGVSEHDAIRFLNKIGDNDSLVSASRYGNAVIISQGETASEGLSFMTGLNKALDNRKLNASGEVEEQQEQ